MLSNAARDDKGPITLFFGNGTGDLGERVEVFVSFYAYWHGYLQSIPIDDSHLLNDVPTDESGRALFGDAMAASCGKGSGMETPSLSLNTYR